MSSITRRVFVAGSAAAIGGACLGRLGYAAEDPAGQPPLTLGIQMYSLRGFDRDQAVTLARQLGFRQLEFYPGMLPITTAADEVRAFRDKLAAEGLSLSAHGVNRFTANGEQNRAIFELAKAAGIRNLTADPDPDSFDSLDELVREYDIRIAIHNHGPRHRYNRVVDVLRAIENHDERIGACADLGHYIRSGEQPPDVVRALRGRLYGVHLKDFAEMTDKTHGVILGQGHLDCRAVFAELIDADFPADGALSLEYEENPKDPVDDIRRCVQVANEALAALAAK